MESHEAERGSHCMNPTATIAPHYVCSPPHFYSPPNPTSLVVARAVKIFLIIADGGGKNGKKS